MKEIKMSFRILCNLGSWKLKVGDKVIVSGF